MTKQNNALRLAELLTADEWPGHMTLVSYARECAAELRRQYAENTTLQQGYAAARLEIESLKAQSADAMHGEHAELRRLSDCCPELNLSNYGPDDVDELNGWAIEVSQCIDRALAAQPAGAQQPGAAYAALPDAPLSVFSKGPWTFKETGQNFSGAELDEAAFVAYRDRASHGQAPTGESLRTDALCDLSYSHGLKAGWNYCASDDLAGFERAQKIGAEALRTLKSPTAQAAPAAVAGPSISQVTEQMRAAGDHAWMTSDGVDSARVFWAMLAAAPTTQPAPRQAPSHTSMHLAEMVLSDCGHSSNYTPLLERVAARIDAHVERILGDVPSPASQVDALDAARAAQQEGK